MLKDFSKERFDVVLQGGQSNAEGGGMGSVRECYVPSGKVWYLNQDFTISQAQERVAGNNIYADFSLEFARRYIDDGRLAENRSMLIIRAAVGGTGFADKRWGTDGDLFLQMMEMTKTALELSNENRLVAFLWHQGEFDACYNVCYDIHYNNLSTLVQTVRGEFSPPGVPFVAGDFVELWRKNNPAIAAPVIEALRGVCAKIGDAAFVETGGLKSNCEAAGYETGADGMADDIHFSRAALYELGNRYYEAFKEIMNEGETNNAII